MRILLRTSMFMKKVNAIACNIQAHVFFATRLGKGLPKLAMLVILFASHVVSAQNIFSGEGVNWVGQINGYSQPTNLAAGDYRVMQYRKVSTTATNPGDGRGQWATTINVQATGGNVTPSNMTGGGGNGFIFTSGPTGNLWSNKWNFASIASGALNAVNGVQHVTTGGQDMGLNMSTAGHYTFVLKDAGYSSTGFYVGYTTNAPVNITHTTATQLAMQSDRSAVVSFTLSGTPSTQERFFVRYRTTTNDFSTTNTVVEATQVSGTTYAATIPTQAAGTNVFYYIFSSTMTLSAITTGNAADIAYEALRYADNSGNNYSYTVISPNGTLDFGTTANGTTSTTVNTGFGGVRVGSGGGGFTIQNPGQSIGTNGELRGIAPTTGSINSVGITSTEYGTAATTFTISFELHLSGGSSGTWYFVAGNGSSFSSLQSSQPTFAQVFTGIEWVFGASNAITTNNRAAGTWSAVSGTPFAQSTAYYVTIVGNNSASSVSYGASNAYSVAAYKQDLWVNGTLVGNDLSKGELGNSTEINAFRFYGMNSASNVATIALDNIRWYNTCTLPPTHLALVSVPTTGTVGSNLNSFTAEARSGSSTGPVANSFIGAITLAKVSGAGSISGTTAPNATAGVATYSNIQFSSADTYTINASAAAPIVDAATSGNITVSSFSSSSSNIILNSGFTHPTNIDYSAYQAASGLTTGNSIEVGQFTIQDGGGSADADALSTTLTACSLTVANSANIRALALFDGSTNIGEITTVGSTAAFSGLTLAAADNGSKTFSVRATFKSAVTDNQQISFTVASATASGAGSNFANANAGAAATTTTGDNNRIEVATTDVVFDQNVSTVAQNAVMSPSPTVKAVDANGNFDLDNTSNVVMTISTGLTTFDAAATTTVAMVSGLATFSNLIFSTAATTNNLTATQGAYTDISSSFDVTASAPEINIKQGAANLASGSGTYAAGTIVSGNSGSAVTFTIENLGSANLTYSSINNSNTTDFTLNTTATSSPISASGNTTFTVTFNPTTNGSKSTTITINNNDADEGTYTFTVTGTGTASSASDIITNSGYSYSSNIDYASFQTTSTLTTGNSVGVADFIIQDGAGAADADNLGTTLTAISFTTGGSTAIRTAALFDGVTNVAEVAVNGATTISFSGLTLSATDASTKNFELRVTYQSSVTDNQQITFTVNSATASATASSFASANAGNAASTATSDINRLEVTADRLAFVTQPNTTTINTALSPSVTVSANDVNGNRDLDYVTDMIASTTATFALASTNTVTPTAGLGTFSNLQFSTAALTKTIAVTSGSLTNSGNSSTFNIYDAQPSTQASAITFTNVGMTSMTINWTNGSGANRMVVVKAAGAPGTPSDGQTYTANTIFGSGSTFGANEFVVYNGNGNTVNITGLTASTSYSVKVFEYNGSGGTENYITTSNNTSQITSTLTYYSNGSGDPAVLANWKTERAGTGSSPTNFISGETFVIESGDVMTTTTTWSISGTGSKLQIENGGTLTANNAITLAAATTFQIDNGGTYIHSNTSAFGSTIFAGIESFSSNSTIEFRDWNTTGPSVSAWGNVKFNATGAVAGSLQLGGSLTTINGNLEIVATGSPTAREIRFAAGTAPTITIAGNYTQAAGIVNLASSSGSSVTTLNVGGNFAVNGGTFTSTSTGSKVVFNGSGAQTFTNNGTISVVNFEIATNAVVDLGTNIISGTGTVTVNNGGTLKLGSTSASGAIAGNITATGGLVLNSGSIVEFNGSTAQTLAARTLQNLTINNASGVTQTGTVTVNGKLTINTSSILDAAAQTINFGVGASAEINGTFKTANTNGFMGGATTTLNNTNSPTITFGLNSTIEYNASSAQAISTHAGYNNLTISGNSTKTISGATTINGILTLNAGVLDAANMLTIRDTGSIVHNGGTIINYILPSDLKNYTPPTGTTTLSSNLALSGNLNIGSNILDIGSNTLTVNGGITRTTGTIKTNLGTLILGGTTSSTLHFDQTTDGVTNKLKDLTINRTGATVTLGNKLQIADNGTITVTNGTLATGGNLVLTSTLSGTGRIASLIGGASVTGNVEIQRYMVGGATSQRGWRYMSTPVASATYAQLIDDIFITGPGGATNGFDMGGTNSSVMYYEESTARGWKSISSPNNIWTAGKGAIVFFRGDRTQTTSLTNTLIAPNSFALDYIGNINSGNYTVNLDYDNTVGIPDNQGWNLIGNPYPSQIDWNNVSKTSGVSSHYYLINPNTKNYVSANTGIIAVGQGFFVQVNAGSQSVSFEENDKTSSTGTAYFKTSVNPLTIKMNMDSIQHDVAKIYFENNANKNYLFVEDAIKLKNSVYNLSIVTPNNFEVQNNHTPFLGSTGTDTFELKVTSTTNSTYNLSFDNFNQVPSNKAIVLVDKLNNSITNLRVTPNYTFTINNSISASFGKRFLLIITDQLSTLPVKLIAFSGNNRGKHNELLWTTSNEKNMVSYDVQRATDGINFETIGLIKPSNVSNNSNYLFDDYTFKNQTNYYRLKMVDSKTIEYSNTIVISNDLKTNAISLVNVFPNPANKLLNISIPQGALTGLVKILDIHGKIVLETTEYENIDISMLNTGIYMINTEINNEAVSLKFVKIP